MLTDQHKKNLSIAKNRTLDKKLVDLNLNDVMIIK